MKQTTFLDQWEHEEYAGTSVLPHIKRITHKRERMNLRHETRNLIKEYARKKYNR